MNVLKKTLVVDDSEQLVLMYRMILLRYRCAVVDARNGQEALYRLAGNPDTNLILLDIHMPLMGGLDFIKAVKMQERCREIPIIIASTAGMEDAAREGLALGAHGCLVKPFTASALHAEIEKLYPAFAPDAFREFAGTR